MAALNKKKTQKKKNSKRKGGIEGKGKGIEGKGKGIEGKGKGIEGKGIEGNSCNTRFCQKYYVPKVQAIARTRRMKYIVKQNASDQPVFIQKLEAKLKKDTPEMQRMCELDYCNAENCSGTIYEPGPDLSESAVQNLRKQFQYADPHPTEEITKSMIQSVRNQRNKRIFKGKKNVLKDGFYTELPGVADLKRRGATSGCASAAFLELT
jgi:hypothetical protein